jgi:MOSC domain-containing protein YiiM
MAEDTIEISSVQVGRPAVLGTTVAGIEVRSAIVKQRVDPVTTPTLALSQINLDGDDQADRMVHGGPDKAVYAYSADHFGPWSDELGREVGAGWFGENVTVAGVTEHDVCIGDRWTWGDAVLEVCQPRSPCSKLTMRTQVRDIARRLTGAGRTGWYLRVIEPGSVPVAGPITVTLRHRAHVSVLEAHLAVWDRRVVDLERRDQVGAVAELADEWRSALP